MKALSRRELLAGAGALVVSFRAGAQSSGPPYTRVPTDQTDSWIAIGVDGRVTGFSGRCDFGQGFGTVQHQLIAEELSVPLDRVSLVICDTAMTPDQGVSSGSQGSPTQFGSRALRQALATARKALLELASKRFSVAADQLVVADGAISVKGDNGRRATYGELLAGRKIELAIDPSAPVRPPSEYRVLGQSIPRLDIPAKAAGTFEFVQNIRLEGMRHGRVVRPPAVGAKLVRVDEASVRGLPGNVRVVVKKDFVGVVADTQWRAQQAAARLKVEWTAGEALPAQSGLYEWMKQQPTRDAFAVDSGDVDAKLKSASRVFTAAYRHPYQLHGSLGTSCAVADVKGKGAEGEATIWSASQGVYPQRDSVARILEIPAENIRVIHVEGSGCYGLNGADSVTYDAAILSQAVGQPVRLQYSRRDEMTGADSFGPAYIVELKAGVDEKGQLTVWDQESWSLSKGSRPNRNAPGNVIAGALAGFPTPAVTAGGEPSRASRFSNSSNTAPSYVRGCVGGACGGTGTVASERMLTHTIASPFFTGPLRSPNRLQNTFAHESFIEEIAAELRVDPIEFRLRHLADPRLIDAVKAAAKAANWQTRPSPNPARPRTGVARGRGAAIVLYEGNNGYSCLIAEVRVNLATGEIVVERFVQSQDSGPVSNPNGMENQLEGGTMQGMSRALFEEVRWNDRALVSADWRSYPVYRFGQFLPKIVNVPIHRTDVLQMGAGEGTITVVAAAIANAVFDATGARLRQVPFTPARVLEALRARA